ncbi:MAG: hypothetical protein JWQ70_432, partial [Aeromicrobium sp.]|nr:hypothetical protein [Aeromicrobium sp.]
ASGQSIRAGVVVGGMVITVGVGVIGWLLISRTAGVIAAFVYAVIGLAPHLEGMTLNGELLASIPSTASIAAAAWWWKRQGSPWWLFGAGLLAGLAVTFKQSGLDGLVVGVVIIALAGPRVWRHLGLFLAGAAVPIGASVLHGVATGWSSYWSALAGYQLAALGGPSASEAVRWSDFTRHLNDIWPDLAPLIIISLAAWFVVERSTRWVLAWWLLAGLVGVSLGGSYWPHYYMQLLPVLVVLAAAVVAAIRSTVVATLVVGALVGPTVWWLGALVPMSADRRAETIPYDALAQRDDRIAHTIRSTTAPTDRIYVLESAAYIYFAAQRQSSYPYLWGKPIEKIPTALPRLRTMLSSPDRPTLVVLAARPETVDPSGKLGAELAEHYHRDAVIDGVRILRAN